MSHLAAGSVRAPALSALRSLTAWSSAAPRRSTVVSLGSPPLRSTRLSNFERRCGALGDRCCSVLSGGVTPSARDPGLGVVTTALCQSVTSEPGVSAALAARGEGSPSRLPSGNESETARGNLRVQRPSLIAVARWSPPRIVLRAQTEESADDSDAASGVRCTSHPRLLSSARAEDSVGCRSSALSRWCGELSHRRAGADLTRRARETPDVLGAHHVEMRRTRTRGDRGGTNGADDAQDRGAHHGAISAEGHSRAVTDAEGEQGGGRKGAATATNTADSEDRRTRDTQRHRTTPRSTLGKDYS